MRALFLFFSFVGSVAFAECTILHNDGRLAGTVDEAGRVKLNKAIVSGPSTESIGYATFSGDFYRTSGSTSKRTGYVGLDGSIFFDRDNRNVRLGSINEDNEVIVDSAILGESYVIGSIRSCSQNYIRGAVGAFFLLLNRMHTYVDVSGEGESAEVAIEKLKTKAEVKAKKNCKKKGFGGAAQRLGNSGKCMVLPLGENYTAWCNNVIFYCL